MAVREKYPLLWLALVIREGNDFPWFILPMLWDLFSLFALVFLEKWQFNLLALIFLRARTVLFDPPWQLQRENCSLSVGLVLLKRTLLLRLYWSFRRRKVVSYSLRQLEKKDSFLDLLRPVRGKLSPWLSLAAHEAKWFQSISPFTYKMISFQF